MEDKFMKKILTLAIVSLMVTSSAMAADTYVGTFLEKQQKKIDTAASPLINKERQLQAQQKAALELQQKQKIERQKQLDAQKKAIADRQAAQQALIEKKKLELANTKDSLKKEKDSIKDTLQQEKQSWKDLFGVK